MTHLSLNNISKQFANNTVVKDFNLDVEKGEFVSFLGPSGCGKTTTLRMIAGFEIPTTGTVTLEDEDITNKAPNQRNVGMVFQAYALFPNMTVAQNIGFGLKIRREKKEAIKATVTGNACPDPPRAKRGQLPLPAFWWTAAARGIGTCPGHSSRGASAG